MKTVQGEFATPAQAQSAVADLEAQGVAPGDIRVWNVIPAGMPSRPGTYARAAGGLAGALLGGLPGYLAGATVGSALDAAGAESPHLPDPTGVRVVVETSPSCPDPAAILRNHGASNVH